MVHLSVGCAFDVYNHNIPHEEELHRVGSQDTDQSSLGCRERYLYLGIPHEESSLIKPQILDARNPEPINPKPINPKPLKS